ncbi:hypothetical protein LZ30DRAFT_322065 [Colletotrichum cereale]|nr:hypothetical protein LZ30DRAFT_322065 [Colletotrichum cereale]
MWAGVSSTFDARQGTLIQGIGFAASLSPDNPLHPGGPPFFAIRYWTPRPPLCPGLSCLYPCVGVSRPREERAYLVSTLGLDTDGVTSFRSIPCSMGFWASRGIVLWVFGWLQFRKAAGVLPPPLVTHALFLDIRTGRRLTLSAVRGRQRVGTSFQ